MTDPATDRTIDLDAAREARAAERGVAPTLKWNGETYQLPIELPSRFLDAISIDDLGGAFAALFDGSGIDVAAFLDDTSYDDLIFISESIAPLYGIEGGLGNLRTSGASSSTTSKR